MALFRYRRKQSDFDAELEAHIALEADRLKEEGLSEQEARAAARRAFGSVTQAQEWFYESSHWRWWNELRQDLRYGLRQLLRSPVFTIVAIVTLALGVGANTAIFSAIHAILLKPLDYRDPDRLVKLSGGASLAHFEELRTGKSFSDVGAFAIGMENLTISGRGEPEVLKAARVSANFLSVLGIPPLLGRSFLPEEDTPGGAAVVLISVEVWERQFNGDRHVIGKTINLAGTPCVIVGVLPNGFDFPFPHADVWVTKPTEWSFMSAQSRRISPFLAVFGRLRPGVTLDEASAELAVMQHRYALEHPTMLDAKTKGPIRARLWKDELVSRARSMLWMLFGAVSFVLAIACANITNLLLARSSARSREFAVRSALGASRARLIGQMLVESVLLSILGGIFGILLAYGALRAASHTNALDLPRAGAIHMDGMVLGFAAMLSIATGILFGLTPSLDASRLDLMRGLRIGKQTIEGPTERLRLGLTTRGILVIGQVALSIVLLIGASLLIESVLYLNTTNPGFNAQHLLTMQVALPLVHYNTGQKRADFFQALVERVQSIPGVENATAALTLPMTPFPGTPVQDAAKPPLKLNQRPIATALIVLPGYFRTLEVPFRRGRDFTDHDGAEGQRVAIIDEDLARRFWPSYPNGENPIGQRLLIGGINPQPAEIVGIVAHVRQNLEDSAWRETVYTSFAQNAQSSAILAVRTQWNPLEFTASIRREVQALDRDQSITAVHTMDDLIEAQLGQRHSLMMLLGSFAAFAVLMAAVGLYGLIAYSVVRRTKELGIRRALGARESEILSQVMEPALVLTLAGIVVGIAAAIALTRLLQGLLFHISATDPATFAGIALLLIVVASIASYIPARRATQVNPMAALRIE